MIEILIAPICLVIDQYFKNKAVERSAITSERTLFGGKIKLGLVYNEGAFLGFLSSHKKLLMLANIGSLLILWCAFIGLSFTKGQHVLKFGLAFMTGGAMGNIYDRFKRQKVVDFFSFKWKPDIYFNLADMFVFLGGILMVMGSVIAKCRK
ncbi:MAG: signal peptidase II [Vallitaleaceae bacterium]|nr:signal peptidase II [Vallitaleaceae bacterium]